MSIEVSVIIPVFNGENKLKISIESLLAQTFKNFEIIIVDDGSTDATLEVIKKYSENDNLNINVYSQKNSGVSKARNKGIQLSKGKYICFLDADDFYCSDFLKEMVTRIKSEGKKVCYCGYNLVTTNSCRKKTTSFSKRKLLRKYILGQLSLHTTCWIIEREYIIRNSIFFPKGVSWGEDFEFFCEVLSLTNEVTFVKKYLTNYRVGFEENQLSAFSIDKIEKDTKSIYRMVNNKKVADKKEVIDSLLNYRLQALITYRLLMAINSKVETDVIVKYYTEYKDHLSKLSKINGLRSIKLELNKKKLSIKLRKM